MIKNPNTKSSKDNHSKPRKYKNQKSGEDLLKNRIKPQQEKQKNDEFFYQNRTDTDYPVITDSNNVPNPQKNNNKFNRHKNKVNYKSISNSESKEDPNQISLLEIYWNESLSVSEFSERTRISETEIIKYLFSKGYRVTITQTLDIDTIRLIGEKFDVGIKLKDGLSPSSGDSSIHNDKEISSMKLIKSRAPVVTVMGHVDHGKTTLLDTIQKVDNVKNEIGKITQKIIAHEIFYKGYKIIFLDTPGHEAFKTIRSRGALISDIAILVIAADEGIRPQTIESIRHFKQLNTPIIVAINKIDKKEANIDKTKQALAKYDIIPEDLGGDDIIVPVSALNGSNIESLLETILLLTDIQDLKANFKGIARATVIEAHLDKSKGPVATLLLQNGLLHVGDVIRAGVAIGKVRSIIDNKREKLNSATPSSIIEITGFNTVPEVGEILETISDEKTAKLEAKTYKQEWKKNSTYEFSKYSNVTPDSDNCNLIIRADVQSSVEAIIGMIDQLPKNKVKINMVSAQTGEISETDIKLALATNSYIINFNTPVTTRIKKIAAQKTITLVEHNIIYKLIDLVEELLKTKIKPSYERIQIGEGIIKAVFSVSKGTVAGCYIQNGKLTSSSYIEIFRDSKIIHQSYLTSLRREKESSEEVLQGKDCGILISGFDNWRTDDVIKIFELKTKALTLE
nr:translation initiation factor 2 [Cavernulicola chilensis]